MAMDGWMGVCVLGCLGVIGGDAGRLDAWNWADDDDRCVILEGTLKRGPLLGCKLIHGRWIVNSSSNLRNERLVILYELIIVKRKRQT
jgi:hypothetical protein